MDIALASECGALAFIILASVLSVTTLFQKYPFKALILVQAGAQIAAGKIEGFVMVISSYGYQNNSCNIIGFTL